MTCFTYRKFLVIFSSISASSFLQNSFPVLWLQFSPLWVCPKYYVQHAGQNIAPFCTLLSGQIGLIRVLLVWLTASSLRGLPLAAISLLPPLIAICSHFSGLTPDTVWLTFTAGCDLICLLALVLHLSSSLSYFVHLWLFVSISCLFVRLCVLTVHTQKFIHIGTVRHVVNHASDIINWKLLFF